MQHHTKSFQFHKLQNNRILLYFCVFKNKLKGHFSPSIMPISTFFFFFFIIFTFIPFKINHLAVIFVLNNEKIINCYHDTFFKRKFYRPHVDTKIYPHIIIIIFLLYHFIYLFIYLFLVLIYYFMFLVEYFVLFCFNLLLLFISGE